MAPSSVFYNLPEEKRQRIAKAAMEEFASTSYEASSINNIIKRCNISRGSFYQYFESKEDLAFHILQCSAQRKITYFDGSAAADEGDCFQVLENYAANAFRYIRENPIEAEAGMSILRSKNFAAEAAISELKQDFASDFTYQTILQHLYKTLAEGQQQGTIRSDIELEFLLNFTLTAIEAMQISYLRSADKSSLDLFQAGASDAIKILKTGLNSANNKNSNGL